MHTPGLKVVFLPTAYDAKGLLKSAIRDNNPVLFFEHKFLYRRIKEELPDGRVSRSRWEKPSFAGQGRDLTIVSYAAMVHASLEAAAQLANEGIEAEVIDLRTLLPLDRETILDSVRRTNRLLVVHEDTRTGGIAGEIAALVCESGLRRSRRAHPPSDRSGYAGAVLGSAGGTLSAECRERSPRRRAGTGASYRTGS